MQLILDCNREIHAPELSTARLVICTKKILRVRVINILTFF